LQERAGGDVSCEPVKNEKEIRILTNKKLIRLLFGVALTAAAMYLVATHIDKIRANIEQRDSVQYWLSARLMIHGGNAYAVTRIRTPPWSLFLFLPLGLAPNALLGWLMWIAASAASLFVTMRLSWKMFGTDEKLRQVFLIVGYLFAPVLACLEAGQIGLVLLIGIVFFMYFENERPYLAGAALVIPLAKPHLLLFFWAAFAIWVLARRKFAIATGFAAAVIGTTILALLIDHQTFQHYQELVRSSTVAGEFIPSLSGVLRLLFFRAYFQAQFVPTLLGLIWSVWYSWRNRAEWSWRSHGLTVMVVSMLTTPYSFLTDEALLLPAMLFAAMCIFGGKQKLPVSTRIAVVFFGFLNWMILIMVASEIPLQSGIYFWSSLLWCGWYFYGRHRLAANGRLRRLAG
jgi:hypothetical protein